jgi:hypothetical protein
MTDWHFGILSKLSFLYILIILEPERFEDLMSFGLGALNTHEILDCCAIKDDECS